MVKGMPFTHKPKGDLYIRGFSINPENFCWYQEYATREEEIGYWRTNEYNNVFSYEHIGDDPYYPSGRVNIKMDKFEKVERAMDKRPVWIIKGASGTGKSTLASHIEGLKVFETDSVDRLPPTIYEDVIVLGNRSKFSVEDVKSRLFGEHEAIVVSFEREGKVKERVNNINIDKNRDR